VERLLTLGEAAETLHIGKTTLRHLVAAGEVETVRIGRRAVRVPAEAVGSYIDRLRERPDVDAAGETDA
jgi:excisionase family DNA binding protein